jgi:hypothetical protein
VYKKLAGGDNLQHMSENYLGQLRYWVRDQGVSVKKKKKNNNIRGRGEASWESCRAAFFIWFKS